jgi:hypothetical protein
VRQRGSAVVARQGKGSGGEWGVGEQGGTRAVGECARVGVSDCVCAGGEHGCAAAN